MQRSSDGGVNWTRREVVYDEPVNIDRPWMALDQDPNSSGYYNIHITVTNQLQSSDRILYLRSTNGGASFSRQTFSGATQHDHGSYVTIGPDNEVHLAWAETNDANGAVTIIRYRRSTNGGASFGDAGAFSASQIGSHQGFGYFVKSGQIRADSYPRLAVDRSPNPSTRGKVYLTWANKGTSNSADVVLRVGTRSGGSISWSNSINLTTGSNDEWMPAVHVNPDGRWGLLYYYVGPGQDEVSVQLREYPAGSITPNQAWDVGVTPRFKITDSYKPLIGDYIGLSGWYGKLFAAWIEAREQVGGSGQRSRRDTIVRDVSGLQFCRRSVLCCNAVCKWHRRTVQGANHHFAGLREAHHELARRATSLSGFCQPLKRRRLGLGRSGVRLAHSSQFARGRYIGGLCEYTLGVDRNLGSSLQARAER